MICNNCHKQIPDSSSICPYCGKSIDHREQLPREIKRRRHQRWFFYGFIVVLFLVMVGIIIRIYNDNTNCILRYEIAKKNYDKINAEKSEFEAKMAEKDGKINELESKISQAELDLDAQTNRYQEALYEKDKLAKKAESAEAEKIKLSQDFQECANSLKTTDSAVYSLIVKLGTGISNVDLAKIPLADANLTGEDTDGDGLPDVLETSLGTNINNKDSDGDGFGDKEEILLGFDPVRKGAKINYDLNLANKLKGSILLQVESNGEAWYVSPDDGKRYFLGRPTDALKVLAGI